MREMILERPWVFTGVVVLVWILLWGSIEVFLFDGDLIGSIITGALSGLIFAIFYIVLGRQWEE